MNVLFRTEITDRTWSCRDICDISQGINIEVAVVDILDGQRGGWLGDVVDDETPDSVECGNA